VFCDDNELDGFTVGALDALNMENPQMVKKGEYPLSPFPPLDSFE